MVNKLINKYLTLILYFQEQALCFYWWRQGSTVSFPVPIIIFVFSTYDASCWVLITYRALGILPHAIVASCKHKHCPVLQVRCICHTSVHVAIYSLFFQKATKNVKILFVLNKTLMVTNSLLCYTFTENKCWVFLDRIHLKMNQLSA
jgi:hypothetical protein